MWKKLLTVYVLFGISLAILIALSLYAFQRFNAYVQYADAVDRNHEIISDLNTLKVQLTEGENSQRAFILFSDSSFYFSFEHHLADVTKTFSDIYTRLKADANQRPRLHALNISIKSQLEYLRSGMVIGYPTTNYKFEKAYMERSLSIISEIERVEKDLLNDQIRTRKTYEAATPQNFTIVFIFTLAVFITSFLVLISEYRRRMTYQTELEKKVVELNQASSEWEQIAFVASHDLQEPLRKIRTFSDLLLTRFKDKLDEEGKALVERIDVSSARAQSLMVDIVNYNRVVYPREEKVAMDISEILTAVLTEMKPTLESHQATVEHEELPVVTVYPSQIGLLFKSLIENSIKFARPEVPVKISITNSVIARKQLPIQQQLSYQQYHKVVFQDNGIGFENEFSEKIFKMFQRLHGQDSAYSGRGIGLAIVKRIMTNHLGLVIARGRPGRGAKFTLYFPVQ